jgi:hypothetical protein
LYNYDWHLTASSTIGLQSAGRTGRFVLDRVFLGANVLYSAAYMEFAGVARLWSLDDVQLLSSAYAIAKARRNLAMVGPRRCRGSSG